MSSPETDKICLVCTAPIRFSRLGVPACRACAAFFKRTKAAKKQYICRRGDNQCVFRKHEKFMCRLCRYEKCVELGMEYDDPKDKQIKIEESDDANEPSTSKGLEERKLLEAMRVAYEKSIVKRAAQEREVAKRHRLKRFDHPTEEFYISSFHSFLDMFPDIIREIVDIFEHICPFLTKLILEDKAALFQHFIGKFVLIEGFYQSYTHLQTDRYFFASLITCIDGDNIDQWIRDEDLAERKDDFRKFIKNYSNEYAQLLCPLLSIEQFTSTEFMAVLILGFCDIDLSLDIPEFIFDTLASIRQRVFTELQDYYRNEENISDVSSRMGKLMTVLHSTCKAGLLMNEEYRLYATLFDTESGDSLLREIFFQ